MYTPLQLDIIRKFGRKKLTEGCIIFNESLGEYSRFLRQWDGMYITSGVDCENCWHPDNCRILGHIPHLFPDVARVMRDRGWSIDYEENLNASHIGELYITHYQGNTVIPFNSIIELLDQDESTLTQLLTLFKKG